MTTAPPRAQLVITLAADGTVGVNGPIQDKILCYGLLECARDAINGYAAKQARSPIVPASAADPFLMARRPNGGANGG